VVRNEHRRYLEVGIVEVVQNVPAKHQKLAAFNEDRVEEAQRKQQLLVFVWFVTPSELLVSDSLIQTFHIRFQALHPRNHRLERDARPTSAVGNFDKRLQPKKRSAIFSEQRLHWRHSVLTCKKPLHEVEKEIVKLKRKKEKVILNLASCKIIAIAVALASNPYSVHKDIFAQLTSESKITFGGSVVILMPA
jgi:hypothetical protein